MSADNPLAEALAERLAEVTAERDALREENARILGEHALQAATAYRTSVEERNQLRAPVAALAQALVYITQAPTDTDIVTYARSFDILSLLSGSWFAEIVREREAEQAVIAAVRDGDIIAAINRLEELDAITAARGKA